MYIPDEVHVACQHTLLAMRSPLGWQLTSSQPAGGEQAVLISADLTQQAGGVLVDSAASCMADQQLCSLTDDPVLKQHQVTAGLQLMSQGCNSDAWTKPHSLD